MELLLNVFHRLLNVEESNCVRKGVTPCLHQVSVQPSESPRVHGTCACSCGGE